MFLDNITYRRETEHAFKGKHKRKADSLFRRMIKVVNFFHSIHLVCSGFKKSTQSSFAQIKGIVFLSALSSSCLFIFT